MVVAGAKVAIGAQGVALTPYHQAELGVGLVFHEAEHDVHPGPFQIAGPFQVGFLVKPRLDLDQGRDALAMLGGLDEGGHDRAFPARAIQGLFDRQHIGVACRLQQELHHHVEALERMVHQNIFFAHGGEHVTALVADALRKAGLERRELQFGPVGRDQGGHLG